MGKIYIIRHGKTEMNKANLLQGRSDYPLNEEGIRQAQKAAELLRDVHFDHVFSSPLGRALQTAAILVPGVKPAVDELLIEMDYGPFEGTDLTRLPVDFDEAVQYARRSEFVKRLLPDGYLSAYSKR